MNYPFPPKIVAPEAFTLEPYYDGSLLLTINGTEHRLPLNTARFLSQQLISQSEKARRLVIPEQ